MEWALFLMKPARFSYFLPHNAAEAVEKIAGAGDDARFLAGGQSLIPMMNFRIARPVALVDLSACNDLMFIRRDAGKLRIGAMTRQRDAELDEAVGQYCPLIAQALSHAGPLTVRNRATVGGTIANGYPVAQLPVVALCLSAEIMLVGPNGERSVSAKDFFTAAFVTAIGAGELLREIVFPVTGRQTRYAFVERGNHSSGAALAIVAACAEEGPNGRPTKVSLAVAGLRPIPVRLSHVEAAVTNGDANVREALAADLEVMDRSVEGADPDARQRQLVGVAVEDAIASLRAPREMAT